MATFFPPAARAGECVVLLHGLARSANSLLLMEWSLKRAGYDVVNVDYPSKDATIEDLADRAIPEASFSCRKSETVHFVTHSMGGILLRYYMERVSTVPQIWRVATCAQPWRRTIIIHRCALQPWRWPRILDLRVPGG